MEDAEGQLQEVAAPHADGVAAGIIAAAQQAATDLAELPALVRNSTGVWLDPNPPALMLLSFCGPVVLHCVPNDRKPRTFSTASWRRTW